MAVKNKEVTVPIIVLIIVVAKVCKILGFTKTA
jgi:hypothetical protein